MNTIDWNQCLSRIGLSALPQPSEASLGSLLRAFRINIPFENLDVLAGTQVSTDVGEVANKLLHEQRGGWCFEISLLFADLLRACGFNVTLRLARVGYRRPSLGPLSHLLLAVSVKDKTWLVDPGFGGPGPLEPLMLTPGQVQDSFGCLWRIDDDPDGSTLSRWMEGQWQRLYTLASLNILPIDVEVASFFLSHWPASPFKRMLMCVAFDGEKYWSIEGLALVQRDIHWMEVSRTPIQDSDHLATALHAHFGIRISARTCEAAWRTCVRG